MTPAMVWLDAQGGHGCAAIPLAVVASADKALCGGPQALFAVQQSFRLNTVTFLRRYLTQLPGARAIYLKVDTTHLSPF